MTITITRKKMKKRIIMALVTMLICGSICAQEQHYTFNYHEFQHQMTAIVQVNIDGVEQTSSDIELGAFNGETVTGSERIGVYGSAGYHRVYLAVYFNQVYDVSFKIYNHQTGVELDNYNVTFEGEPFTMACVPDAAYGLRKNPIVINFTSSSTFTKDITPYTEGTKDHYYLIASPVGTVNVDDVTHLKDNSFDLYYFDQAATDGKVWINYNQGENQAAGFNTLEAGKGYLYANSGDVTLTFVGTPYSGNGQVTLNKTEGADWSGWNLVGNPFNQTAYLERAFYVINPEGRNEIILANRNSVEAMEGVFVIAENDGDVATFSTTEPDKSRVQLVMNLTKNRGTVVDRAILSFGEGRQLPKFQLPKFQLRESSTKVYIPQEGNDYAMVNAESNMGELPLSFKAENSGSYTLDFSADNVSFNYLHLIDNKTGKEVDLLETPSYSFEASTTDYANRFKLVFATGESTEDNFAFFSNGSFVISNEGVAMLQVIDVTGRILKNEQISGSANVSVNAAPGVYMLRLVNGDNVKVQKVVVK